MKNFYITLAVLCVFLVCLSTNYDYDLFARLIVGERFVENGILPFKDFLSYTPTHPWYDHEWGSGVVFYTALKYFGVFGLILLQSVLMFGTAFFVIKTQKLQKHAFPTSVLFMTVFLVLVKHLNSELVRCQLFSFFFFALFLYVLERTRKQGGNLVWIIPPVVVLWNNLHGGVVSGLGLVFMYLAGAVLERKPWKKFFGVLALSTPLLVINPYGVKYLNFLFSAATMHRKYIPEWWPFYAKRHILYYILPSIYGILGTGLSFKTKKIDITKTIVLLVTLYMGLAHVKLLSLTLIATAALCYNEFVKLFSYFKRFEKYVYPVIIITALSIPLFSPLVPRADFSKYPLKEVEFLEINNIKGNLLVPFGLGSYVSYKRFPDNLIYMDGRYEEVYNDKEFLQLRDYELGEPNWDGIVKDYPTEILMPYKHLEIYPILKSDSNWSLIYEGNLCGIFVKKEALKESYKEPTKDIMYYRKNMFEHKNWEEK